MWNHDSEILHEITFHNNNLIPDPSMALEVNGYVELRSIVFRLNCAVLY